MKMPSPAVRRWFYLIALAAMPILVAYGIVGESEAPLWVAFVGAVLVPGLAAANTPPPERTTTRRIDI